jgi:hypothetical protein
MMNLRRPVPRTASLLLAGSLGAAAPAGAPQTWNFDVTTTGNDVFWTSPTAVSNTAALYDGVFEVTLLEVHVRYLFFNLGPFNVTDQIPPDQRMGSDTIAGPPPLVIYDGSFIYPDPPEPTSFAGTLLMTLDAAGYAQISLTDITLGTAQIDLGPPLGLQTVLLTSVRVAGHVTVTPVTPGDVDRNGVVDVLDLLALLAAWGACPADPEPCPADFNVDSAVSVTDLLMLLANGNG